MSGAEPDPLTARWPALGTMATVLVPAESGEAALHAAVTIVGKEVSAFDRAASRFRPDSELTALNAAGGRETTVSRLLLEAIETALRAAMLTGGLVNPTIGAVMRVLGYDRDFSQVDPDGPPLRVTGHCVPAWQHVELNRARATVRVPAGAELDLGSTAKALCADRAAAAAAETAGCGVLVSLGGDLAVAGPSPGGGWRVRVTDHHATDPQATDPQATEPRATDPQATGANATDAPGGDAGQTVLISSGGLATSGTTARHWSRGTQLLHHVIDPSTGLPADGHWRTVSVAAGTCVDANTASTASIILGPWAPAWLAARRLPGRLVTPGGQVIRVDRWPAARHAVDSRPAEEARSTARQAADRTRLRSC